MSTASVRMCNMLMNFTSSPVYHIQSCLSQQCDCGTRLLYTYGVYILFIQVINFSQTQQFITQNVLMATCFDSIESSSGLPKNRSNVSKFIVHSGIPNAYSCKRLGSIILHCALIHTQNRTELIWGHTTEQFNNEVY